jgi:hypothetical protein
MLIHFISIGKRKIHFGLLKSSLRSCLEQKERVMGALLKYEAGGFVG